MPRNAVQNGRQNQAAKSLLLIKPMFFLMWCSSVCGMKNPSGCRRSCGYCAAPNPVQTPRSRIRAIGVTVLCGVSWVCAKSPPPRRCTRANCSIIHPPHRPTAPHFGHAIAARSSAKSIAALRYPYISANKSMPHLGAAHGKLCNSP